MRRPERRTTGHVGELPQVTPKGQPALLQHHRPPTFLGAVRATGRVATPASSYTLVKDKTPHCVHRLSHDLCRHLHPSQLDWMEERESRREGTNTQGRQRSFRSARRAIDTSALCPSTHHPRSSVELEVGPTYPLRMPPFLFLLFPKHSVDCIVTKLLALSIVRVDCALVEPWVIDVAVAVHPRQNGDVEQRSTSAKCAPVGGGGAVSVSICRSVPGTPVRFGAFVCQS